MQNKGNPVVNPVYFRHGLHPCKGKTEGAKVIGKGLGGRCHGIGVVSFTGLDGDKRFELFFLADVIAFQLDAGDHKALAFCHIERDADILLVGRYGDLRGVNLELQVATRQVVGAQGFNVGIEFCA